MKVLHVYKTYFPDSFGGVERAIHQIVLSTASLNVEAQVLSLTTHKNDRTVTVDDHLVHHCRSLFSLASTPFSVSVFPRFAKLAQQADLIHYHFPWPFMDLLHFICRIKKPSVLTYHSDIIRQELLLKLYRPLLKRFLTRVNCIVATSPNYFSTSQVLQSFANKTSVIPIGLDKSSYPVPDDEMMSHWRQRFPGQFFLFIGVFRYYKGLHTLIDAAQGLDYPIVIVGSGPTEQELKTHARARGVKTIHFLGQISDEDKVALLQLCYALVFPSSRRSEAFGVSLLEGAMFGKPMISCEIGTGTSFINIDNETGLVVPPNDASALHQAMHFLWDNPQQAYVLGQQAEQRYWDLFTAEKMGSAYCQLYQGLVNKC